MQNEKRTGPTYKDVCGNERGVWFNLKDKEREGRAFLQWARELGCVWLNGKEIDPSRGTDFFTLEITDGGKLCNVSIYARMARKQSPHPVPVYEFSEYILGF